MYTLQASLQTTAKDKFRVWKQMTVKRFNNNQFSDPSLAEWAPALHRSDTGCQHHWTAGKSYTPFPPPSLTSPSPPHLPTSPPPTTEIINYYKHVSTEPGSESLICQTEMLHFIQTWNNSSQSQPSPSSLDHQFGPDVAPAILTYQSYCWPPTGCPPAPAPTSDKKQQGANTSLMKLGFKQFQQRKTSQNWDYAMNLKCCCELHTGQIIVR